MEISLDFIEQFENIINNSNKILLISHKSPDGDTLGATTAFYDVLTRRGKKADLACVDSVPENLKFLPYSDKFQDSFDLDKYDLICIFDVAATHLLGFLEKYPNILDKNRGVPIINIDHHKSNDNYGTINLVKPESASTTVLLTQVLEKLNWKISSTAATSLLTGIYTDTGSFMHSNTDPLTLKVSSRLLSLGANLRKISKHIFNTTKISTLRLWGRVLRNIYKTEDNITVSVVQENDFKETGTDYTELTGVVDYINSVPDSSFSLLLTEQKKGLVKGSLRTLNDDVDLSEKAQIFGGGGHKKAAGFTLQGKLQKEVKWTVVS